MRLLATTVTSPTGSFNVTSLNVLVSTLSASTEISVGSVTLDCTLISSTVPSKLLSALNVPPLSNCTVPTSASPANTTSEFVPWILNPLAVTPSTVTAMFDANTTNFPVMSTLLIVRSSTTSSATYKLPFTVVMPSRSSSLSIITELEVDNRCPIPSESYSHPSLT